MIKRLYKNPSRAVTYILVATVLFSMLSVSSFAVESSSKGSQIIVSMGDSYSSGEGIDDFYCSDKDISKKVSCEDWLAHRSKNSWPGMLTLPSVSGSMANNSEDNWYFVAASGATTSDITGQQEKLYYKKDGKEVYSGSYYLPAQIDVFNTLNSKSLKADYVTLTLGGNDADFSGVITEVVTGVNYFDKSGLANKINDTWKEYYKDGGIKDNLKKSYELIEEKAGLQAQIIVSGYPQLLEPNGKGIFVSKEEASLVNMAVSNFNNAIEHLVNQCSASGMKICFVSVENAFDGHSAYSDEPYINEVMLGTKEQDIMDFEVYLVYKDDGSIKIQPSVASAYSMHPNYKGAQAYADCVQRKINELESSKNNINDKIPDDAVEYNGHYYYIYEAKKGETDWDKAKENCESKDGYLATITSEDENKFVFTLLNKFGYKNAYFGLHDEGSNDWKWDNGETFSYSNWASGEPSSSFEDYGMYYYKYTEQWNDGDFSLPEADGKTGYICEWGEYSVVNSEIPVTTPTRATSSERDIVLVLDTSGSMSGTPLEETKKAATNFVDTILEEDASIGIVNYDSDADMKSDFSNSKNSLDSVISELGTGGSTNMEAGLRTANQMLSQSSAKKKIIVLMSDGEPNEGLTGDELIAYADELKGKEIYIYTLGFFESVGEKTAPQSLMEKIASDGCHYEVSDADSLVFFFGDIADQINGQKYIYVRIACPVDVSVTYNGETLDSSETGLSTRTSFGTLTFEESDTQNDTNSFSQQTDSEESSDDRVKILRLKEGEDYDIEIKGTGRGRMNYSIGFMDEEGEYSDFRKFNNIRITRSTQIDTVAEVSDRTVLNVDEDGDGNYDTVYQASANGYGKIIDYSYIVYILVGLVAFLVLLIIILIISNKIKKRKKSY